MESTGYTYPQTGESLRLADMEATEYIQSRVGRRLAELAEKIRQQQEEIIALQEARKAAEIEAAYWQREAQNAVHLEVHELPAEARWHRVPLTGEDVPDDPMDAELDMDVDTLDDDPTLADVLAAAGSGMPRCRHTCSPRYQTTTVFFGRSGKCLTNS